MVKRIKCMALPDSTQLYAQIPKKTRFSGKKVLGHARNVRFHRTCELFRVIGQYNGVVGQDKKPSQRAAERAEMPYFIAFASIKGYALDSVLVERAARREQQHISYARTVSKQHYETVNAVADTTRRRHAEL